MHPLIQKTFENAPMIMGIINVTPDSFSDGNHHFSADKAIEHGLRLIEEGADILDIGGESTRPDAETVSVEEEIKRVKPVIEALAKEDVFLSIDTRNAQTMEVAIKAGVTMINDVSALRHDDRSADIVAASGLPVCIMHMQGTPQTMQINPRYNNVVEEVKFFFEKQIERLYKSGIDPRNIVVDPGIGFGKMVDHNLVLLQDIKSFTTFGCPVLLGASRKSFIKDVCGECKPEERVSGSVAAAIYALSQGVQMFRVHDVKDTLHAFDIYQAILSAA